MCLCQQISWPASEPGIWPWIVIFSEDFHQDAGQEYKMDKIKRRNLQTVMMICWGAGWVTMSRQRWELRIMSQVLLGRWWMMMSTTSLLVEEEGRFRKRKYMPIFFKQPIAGSYSLNSALILTCLSKAALLSLESLPLNSTCVYLPLRHPWRRRQGTASCVEK